MWILTGFLVTIMLCIPIVVQVYRKIKKPVVKPPSTTIVATPAPSTTTVATPAPRARLNWKYVWWPVGIVLGVSLLYFMYMNYNNALASDWYAKHTEFTSQTIPYALAIIIGLLTYLVRKTNRTVYALVIGGIAILIAFLWKNPAVVREFVVGSMIDVGKAGKTVITESTKGITFEDIKPFIPYFLVPLLAGVLTYYTSTEKRYKNFPLAVVSAGIALLCLGFWMHPDFLMTEGDPLKDMSMIDILFKNGSGYLSALIVAIACYLVYIGHTGFALALFLLLMFFSTCQPVA